MTYDAIVLRLVGPMQAWGAPTTEDSRPSYPFPTRSGLVGLLGACLGISFADRAKLVPLSQSFRLVVRRDVSPFEPSVMGDYQTIQDVPTANGGSRTVQSPREYLLDSRFTALLVATGTGAPSFDEIERALVSPHFMPVLGRKCCIPTEPLLAGRFSTEDPLALLATIEPGKGHIWSEIERSGAAMLSVRDVPTESRRRCYTRTVHVFEEI